MFLENHQGQWKDMDTDGIEKRRIRLIKTLMFFPYTQDLMYLTVKASAKMRHV